MIITELIVKLEMLLIKYGDLPVLINQTCYDETCMVIGSISADLLMLQREGINEMTYEQFEHLMDTDAINCIVITDEP